MRVAILGTGNIGTDLLVKVERSKKLDCVMFAGRRANSKGLAWAISKGVPASHEGLKAVSDAKPELVFDCTCAEDHALNSIALGGMHVVNLTPFALGEEMVVPAVNLGDSRSLYEPQRLSLVTCGGQASVPLAVAACKLLDRPPAYVEVVSSISSSSAGPATRDNLDEYIGVTQRALRHFTKCDKAKVALILNPADPPVKMQTSVSIIPVDEELSGEWAQEARQALGKSFYKVQEYCPGYEWAVPPTFDEERIFMSVRVTGAGDWLPEHAGNLDIITSAAVRVAEELT